MTARDPLYVPTLEDADLRGRVAGLAHIILEALANFDWDEATRAAWAMLEALEKRGPTGGTGRPARHREPDEPFSPVVRRLNILPRLIACQEYIEDGAPDVAAVVLAELEIDLNDAIDQNERRRAA